MKDYNEKSKRDSLKIVFWAIIALLFLFAYLVLSGCSKNDLEYARGEDCVCSESARETNTDFCKHICYFLIGT